MAYYHPTNTGGRTDSDARKEASKLTVGSDKHREATTFVDSKGVRTVRGSFQTAGATAASLGYGGQVGSAKVHDLGSDHTLIGDLGVSRGSAVRSPGGFFDNLGKLPATAFEPRPTSWLGQSLWTILGVMPGGQEAATIGFKAGGRVSGRDYKDVLRASDRVYLNPVETDIERGVVAVLDAGSGGQVAALGDFKSFSDTSDSVREYVSGTVDRYTEVLKETTVGGLGEVKDIVKYAAIGLGAIFVLNLTRR